MTNEQINRAVAEALGYRVRQTRAGDGGFELWNQDAQFVNWSHTEVDAWKLTPNFCTDHNAAAEMRNGIKPEERNPLIYALMAVVGTQSVWDIANATPLQQAEAFLRMRGKWRG